MNNPILMPDLASAHRSDLLKEAEIQRQVNEVRAHQAGLRGHAMRSVRSALLSLRRRVIGQAELTAPESLAAEAVIASDR